MLVLVDDRDGRILSEIQVEEEARIVFEAWREGDGRLPEHLCLLEVHAHRGMYLDTDSSVKIRPASLQNWLD